MKTALVCPSSRPGLELGDGVPLAATPILGDSALNHWVEHLTSLGARQVKIISPDDPETLRAVLGDGSRWGVEIEIIPTAIELTAAEAADRYRLAGEPGWLPPPHDIVSLSHLPGCPGLPLNKSHADWFASLIAWMPHALTPTCVRVSEIRPGIWAGRRAHVSRRATLVAPCWIGDLAYVAEGATVGPGAILEERVFVDKAARITQSWVGPDTFVGSMTSLANSLAWGNRLTNWRTDSTLCVTDPFLLCSLAKPAHRPSRRETPERRDPLRSRFPEGLSADPGLGVNKNVILP